MTSTPDSAREQAAARAPEMAPDKTPGKAPTGGQVGSPATTAMRGVLPRSRVRVVAQPALVDCSEGEHGSSLSVVPLMDGDRVAGLEVRCSCGAKTLIECIYRPEEGA